MRTPSPPGWDRVGTRPTTIQGVPTALWAPGFCPEVPVCYARERLTGDLAFRFAPEYILFAPRSIAEFYADVRAAEEEAEDPHPDRVPNHRETACAMVNRAVAILGVERLAALHALGGSTAIYHAVYAADRAARTALP